MLAAAKSPRASWTETNRANVSVTSLCAAEELALNRQNILQPQRRLIDLLRFEQPIDLGQQPVALGKQFLTLAGR